MNLDEEIVLSGLFDVMDELTGMTRAIMKQDNRPEIVDVVANLISLEGKLHRIIHRLQGMSVG